jgi:acid phosphatase (class A)
VKIALPLGSVLGLAAIAFATHAVGQSQPIVTPNAMTAPAAPRMSMSGYLPRGAAPDSLLLNPLPPAPHSAALKRDEEAARAAVKLRGTPRWEQATIDADLFSPTSTGVFSCAAGMTISAETTPKLFAMLRKAGPDLALAVYPSKRHYQRPRPFMANHQPICTPRDEAVLRSDGSYPSGHSAIGYGWGLILAEVIPDRATQLAARGRAFGDSRRVCNVHWLSDIEEGRIVADAVLARLHAEAAFRADLDVARAEVAALRTTAAKPDCARENAALGTQN